MFLDFHSKTSVKVENHFERLNLLYVKPMNLLMLIL